MSEHLTYQGVDLAPLTDLINAHLDGLNDGEIAERIGESVNAVNYVRRMLRLPPARRWAPDKTLAGRVGTDVGKLAAQGLSDAEIGRRLGLAAEAVGRVRRALDAAPASRKDAGKRRTAVRLRDEGLTYTEIGRKIGVSKQRAYQLASEGRGTGLTGKRLYGPRGT